MPNYIDGEMKEQEKVCPTCNGTTTIPTDKSDFDMCPECNAPKKEAIANEIAEKIRDTAHICIGCETAMSGEEINEFIKDNIDDTAKVILDLIAEHYIPKDQDLIKLFKTWVLKQLPREKVCCCNEEELEAWWCSCGAEVHNKTVKDIKHKLEVE